MTNLLDRESDKIDTRRGSLIDDYVAPEPTLEGPVTRSGAEEMTEFPMTQLVDKLDARTLQKTEESLMATMESLDDKHNLTFVRGA